MAVRARALKSGSKSSAKQIQSVEPKRKSSAKRGYSYAWQKARLFFLKQNPLCVECLKSGRVEPATDVDHIIPHKGDMNLFWDRNNWQPLCKSCHSRKTATEDGGFGK